MARKAASRPAHRPIDPADRDRQILSAIDLRSEFAALGVVFAKDFPRSDGWLDCYAVAKLRPDGREDSSPSAGCNIRTGRYHDFGSGENISFWDFAAAMGVAADWRSAREHYAARFGIPPAMSAAPNHAAMAAAAGNGGGRSTRAFTPTASVEGNGSPAKSSSGAAAQSNGSGRAVATPTKAARNPLDQLEFKEWTPAYERLAKLWCLKHKPGVALEAIHAAAGRVAIYKTKTAAYTVLTLPVYGPDLLSALPVAYVAYNLTGGKLPVFRGKGKPIEWIKVKTFGPVSGGLIGRDGIERIQSHADLIHVAWKVEGPSDLLALWSATPAAWREMYPVVCNAGGATEHVQPHVASFFAGLAVNVVHDADEAGENGALKIDRAGRPVGWLPSLAGVTSQVCHVRLPYDIQPKHGKDLRDYLREQGKDGIRELLTLATRTEPYNGPASNLVGPPEDAAIGPDAESCDLAGGDADSPTSTASLPIANEADNDPHRLARVYLAQHSHTLRYWRQEWWRYDGRRYVRFSVAELAAEITAACKAEFDRINLAAIENPSAASTDGKLPEALKVARGLVSNVIGALEGMAIVPGATDQPAWLDRSNSESGSPSNLCISLTNGILDLDALLSGESDAARVLLPHSPNWFSPICLPYAFDPEADCPRWNAFLSRNLEDDEERINLLQEWAGYLLTPDTGQQKFLFLEGEGSNGKSVYHAALEGMLGKENVSHVPLESFAERFALYSTVGKLANIAADCGELDKAAEGILKSFTSGDRMTFDRKNLSPVDSTPTARLSIAANNRPRFSDRSSGLWRRLMVVPFNVQIDDSEKVRGMDKPEWWERIGELPGILNWAIAGLWRLRDQERFTRSELGEAAIDEYRKEVNPARAFLSEICRTGEGKIQTSSLYEFYKGWCRANGYHPINEKNFGKEVFREFPGTKRIRGGPAINRRYEYLGIISDEIIEVEFSQREF